MVNLELYKIYVTVAKEQNITRASEKFVFIRKQRRKGSLNEYKKFRKHTRNKTI